MHKSSRDYYNGTYVMLSNFLNFLFVISTHQKTQTPPAHTALWDWVIRRMLSHTTWTNSSLVTWAYVSTSTHYKIQLIIIRLLQFSCYHSLHVHTRSCGVLQFIDIYKIFMSWLSSAKSQWKTDKRITNSFGLRYIITGSHFNNSFF